MIYFISDLHFGHANIIKLCKRPFANVEEMDCTLIEKWNKKVMRKDTVYVLGDIVWDKNKLAFYMDALKGNKILIRGNHDSTWAKKEESKKYFQSIHQYLEINHDGNPITLCHYPMLEWKNCRDTDGKIGYHIHGHIHNRVAQEYMPLYTQFHALNAGADLNDFTPVTFEELQKNNLQFKLEILEEKEREKLLADYQRYYGKKYF